MLFFQSKAEKVLKTLHNDNKVILFNIKKALESAKVEVGKDMVADANNKSHTEAKQKVLAAALATLASSVASSATKTNVSINSDEVAPAAIAIISVLNSLENGTGEILEK